MDRGLWIVDCLFVSFITITQTEAHAHAQKRTKMEHTATASETTSKKQAEHVVVHVSENRPPKDEDKYVE